MNNDYAYAAQPQFDEHLTKHPTIFVRDRSTSPPSNEWRPGVWRRLPYKSLLALIGAAGCIGAWIAIVHVSSGARVSSWTVQPAVYLAIAVAIANILINYALSQGATIFWWRRAMRQESTLGDLHRDWKYSSFLGALKAGRQVSVMAVATLLVAVVPINGPLLQRASRPGVTVLNMNRTLTFDASPEVPFGFTSVLSGRARAPSILSKPFAAIVSAFSDRLDIAMPDTGCKGNCTGAYLLGAGFAANCSSYSTPWNLTAGASAATQFGVAAFQSDFVWSSSTFNTITLDAQYKTGFSCAGDMQVRNCTLRAATVRYPVIVDGNRSTISLRPGSSIFDDVVVTVLPQNFTSAPWPGDRTTLGGFALALSNAYRSSAVLRWVGAAGTEFLSNGALVNQNIADNNYTGANLDCAVSFTDPTQTLLQAARELMFRTAVGTANGTGVHTSPAVDSVVAVVWMSHYEYLIAAAALTGAAMVAVLPAFWRFWKLGREVSMSPLEVARGFGAGLLQGVAVNAEGGVMAEEVGARAARYLVGEAGALGFVGAVEGGG